MYEFIRGQVDQLTPTSVVVEAAGVGYHLIISLHTYTQIGSADRTKIYTHYVVREDVQLLYGFFTPDERDIFRLLIGVSGVGGNTARMILSTFSPDEVRTLIATGQSDVLKSVKGLGVKTSQKIIVELRDKITSTSTGLDAVAGGTVGGSGAHYQEALAALMMLGFVRTASEKVLQGVYKEYPNASVEELIRVALKKL